MEMTPSEHISETEIRHLYSSQRGSAGLPAIKLGVFIAVATIIAVGAYFGAQEFLLNDDATEDERRPVAVSRGTLLDDITASGSVSFPELESLRFDISGTVAEILVEEGDPVTEGDPLVVLDAVTISALESAVANAEIDIQDAGEDLAELLTGASGLDRAIALSNLADARVTSKNATNALANMTSTDGKDSPATIEAKEDLIAANELLDDKIQTHDDAIQAHADAITAAEDDAAIEAEKIADEQEIYDEAIGDYSGLTAGWFGKVVTEEDRVLAPTALLEKWNITVDEIFNTAAVTSKSPPDDLSTPWDESVVWVWAHLTPYPILTGCEATTAQARCPSAEIDDSWDAVVDAEESLDEAIEDAETAASAQETLILAASNTIDAAQNAIETAQDGVEAAAEAIIETSDAIEIDALAASLAKALESEKDAEATLAALDDIDLLQIKLATTGVNVAKAALDQATADLVSTQLLAPFDGVISSISVSVGDPVNRTTPTIDILDPSVVTVSGTIDEIDVLSLQLGDEVSVELDALPGQILQGIVDEIGDGVNQQGVIEFPLTISLTPPEGIDLIEGLSATASIVLNQIDNALLIPLQAVGGSFSQPTVDVVGSNGPVTTDVTLGASDDFWVIVESGLREGQEVLMEVAATIDPFEQFFGGGSAIRIPGGGGGIRIPGGGGGR